LSGVKQIQINPKVGLTFANGLRSILRHDPDIIMVGEIRDFETAEIAIQASLTGHLVFSTLHTNDAPSAVTRMVDMGVEPYLVASTVEGCLAQRLVRRICKSCRESHARNKGSELVAAAMPKSIENFYRGKGCEQCRNTGYRGRIGLYELMPMDDEIRELVVNKEPASRLKKAALKKGMKSLRDRGWEYVQQGVTTPDEVLRITKEDRF
jgi:type II secretory ATPase GspE/PulE/Tfp pilus assembly ATPase PilB-like protein